MCVCCLLKLTIFALIIFQSERPGLVRYNLRHRPPSPPERNPVVRKESPNTFAKKVKHLAKVAQRNNMKMRHTILRQSQSIYSEDDWEI